MSFMPIYYTEQELDDLVEKWHSGDGNGMEIHEYIGVSIEEYSKWVRNPNHQLLAPLSRL